LKDILYKVAIEGIYGNPITEVSSLSFDSRTIQKDSLYVAQRGLKVDGHKFISQALENGAKAIICELIPKEVKKNVVYVLVKNTAKTLGVIASNFYDNPSEKMDLVGITGTNGKTSIATLLFELFTKQGCDCGLLSTIKIQYGDKVYKNSYTTPDALSLNEHLNNMVKLGITHCFMEVSSHGITQYRTEGLAFSGGVFTNLTHDHLDYHGDFKTYRDTKKSFFDALPKNAFALTNVDDKNGAFMLQNTNAKKYTYAIKQNADFKAKLLEHQFSGMLIKIKNQEVWTSLIGNFNIQNILAVYAVAELFEFSQLDILKQISSLENVEGRFQTFQTQNQITVIIDYAHTPDALENVLETINKIRTRNEKLFTLLGCGGNRDQEKRPIMGQIAAKHSDKVIFTSDNPRNEDPEKIISQMIDGVSQEHFKKISKITLREEAIATSAGLAQDGDVVLIAGKGHESYQEIQGKYYPFSDLKVAKQIFLNLD
jgi:UDP-N-acetylmuramoyl-L-alanyl-D-glutamate--2,6-diaminopimelate ligase